jgi:hypothetical protein
MGTFQRWEYQFCIKWRERYPPRISPLPLICNLRELFLFSSILRTLLLHCHEPVTLPKYSPAINTTILLLKQTSYYILLKKPWLKLEGGIIGKLGRICWIYTLEHSLIYSSTQIHLQAHLLRWGVTFILTPCIFSWNKLMLLESILLQTIIVV